MIRFRRPTSSIRFHHLISSIPLGHLFTLGCLLSSLALVGMLGRAGAENEPAGRPENPFSQNVKVTYTATHMIVESDGIPNHKTAKYPNADNPNTIKKQHYRFQIPLYPKRADKPTPTPFGPIGVALNGIPFYNQYNREGEDAVRLEVFDSCCGHPDPAGRYHYHKFPVCVKSPFKDTPGKHSPLVGYAFDGYGIYGPRGDQGNPPEDLDECNGHSDSESRLSLPRHGRLSVRHRGVSRRGRAKQHRPSAAGRWSARGWPTRRWPARPTSRSSAGWRPAARWPAPGWPGLPTAATSRGRGRVLAASGGCLRIPPAVPAAGATCGVERSSASPNRDGGFLYPCPMSG